MTKPPPGPLVSPLVSALLVQAPTATVAVTPSLAQPLTLLRPARWYDACPTLSQALELVSLLPVAQQQEALQRLQHVLAAWVLTPPARHPAGVAQKALSLGGRRRALDGLSDWEGVLQQLRPHPALQRAAADYLLAHLAGGNRVAASSPSV